MTIPPYPKEYIDAMTLTIPFLQAAQYDDSFSPNNFPLLNNND